MISMLIICPCRSLDQLTCVVWLQGGRFWQLCHFRQPPSATRALNLAGTFAEAGRPATDNSDIMRVSDHGNGTNAAYLAARLKKAGRDDLLDQIGPGKKHRSGRGRSGLKRPREALTHGFGW